MNPYLSRFMLSWWIRNSQHHPLATSAAGGLATIIADGMMAPFDVIKQRMQLRSSSYSSVFSCVSTVYKQYGISAFFVGECIFWGLLRFRGDSK